MVSGEIPILLDYDFNAYRAKYSESANFEFVIPGEGSVVVPYVVGLVTNAPDKAEAKKAIDYRSPTRDRRSGPTPFCDRRGRANAGRGEGEFLPDSDYARAKRSTGARWKRSKKPLSIAIWRRCADAIWRAAGGHHRLMRHSHFDGRACCRGRGDDGFFLLPMVRLVVPGEEGWKGWPAILPS